MTDTTRITYLFDPLCRWCYGVSATLEKLVADPHFVVELAPTGMFAGDGARSMEKHFAEYAWSNDQRISRLTGQPFSEAYRHNVLGDHGCLFDSCLDGPMGGYKRTCVVSTTDLSFSEWAAVFGYAKMTTTLLDRLNRHFHILETGNDSFRFKSSSVKPPSHKGEAEKLDCHRT